MLTDELIKYLVISAALGAIVICIFTFLPWLMIFWLVVILVFMIGGTIAYLIIEDGKPPV